MKYKTMISRSDLMDFFPLNMKVKVRSKFIRMGRQSNTWLILKKKKRKNGTYYRLLHICCHLAVMQPIWNLMFMISQPESDHRWPTIVNLIISGRNQDHSDASDSWRPAPMMRHQRFFGAFSAVWCSCLNFDPSSSLKNSSEKKKSMRSD